MKRIVLYSALAIVTGVLLLRLMQHDAGYVLISVAGKTLEMRFWFAVLVLLLGLLIVYGLVSLLLLIKNILFNGWSLAMASKAKRGAKRTNTGFLQFIEGDWLGAQKTLLKAAKDVDQPVAHYLGAARSAYETGDYKQAEHLIAKAQKLAPEQHVSILIGQARMLFLTERYSECLSILHGIHSSGSHHPVVLDLLYQCYLKQNDWQSLEAALPALRKYQILSNEKLEELELDVYSQLLKLSQGKEPPLVHGTVPKITFEADSENKASEGKGSQTVPAPNVLEDTWNKIPKALKKHTYLVHVYASLLKQQGLHDRAESLLRSSLKKQWSESLIELYALLDASDTKLQLQFAEALLLEHPDSAVLLLALGRICLRCQIWGQAKNYFQSSIKAGATPVAYAELARLQAALDEHELSHSSYQQGLVLVAGELPKLPLPNRQPVFHVQAKTD